MAWIKSIHIHSLSRIVSQCFENSSHVHYWRAPTIPVPNSRCLLSLALGEHFKEQSNCLTMPLRWFPDVNHRACASNLKKYKTAPGHHQCPFSVKIVQGRLQPRHYNNWFELSHDYHCYCMRIQETNTMDISTLHPPFHKIHPGLTSRKE